MTDKPVTALLIIDVQNDFLPPKGSLGVPNGNLVIDPIIELMKSDKWSCVGMTKDWHPASHTSFACNHGLPDFSAFTYKSPILGSNDTQDATLWPVHCVQETWGSEVPPHLLDAFENLKVPHKIVNKGYLEDREYYSGFNDIWKDHRTELDSFLKENKVTEVYVVGLAFDYCVKNTAISSAELGYKTYILKNYTKAISADSNSMEKLADELSSKGVSLV